MTDRRKKKEDASKLEPKKKNPQKGATGAGTGGEPFESPFTRTRMQSIKTVR